MILSSLQVIDFVYDFLPYATGMLGSPMRFDAIASRGYRGCCPESGDAERV